MSDCTCEKDYFRGAKCECDQAFRNENNDEYNGYYTIKCGDCYEDYIIGSKHTCNESTSTNLQLQLDYDYETEICKKCSEEVIKGAEHQCLYVVNPKNRIKKKHY